MKARRKKKKMRALMAFSDLYKLTGQSLGEGIYGKVEICVNVSTGIEYAVNIIEEVPGLDRSKILKEIEINYFCRRCRGCQGCRGCQLKEYFEEANCFYLVFEKMLGGPPSHPTPGFRSPGTIAHLRPCRDDLDSLATRSNGTSSQGEGFNPPLPFHQHPALRQLTGQPVVRQPTGQPVVRQPTGQLVVRQPTGQPVVRQPTGQPVVRQPTGQPVVRQPTGASTSSSILSCAPPGQAKKRKEGRRKDWRPAKGLTITMAGKSSIKVKTILSVAVQRSEKGDSEDQTKERRRRKKEEENEEEEEGWIKLKKKKKSKRMMKEEQENMAWNDFKAIMKKKRDFDKLGNCLEEA